MTFIESDDKKIWPVKLSYTAADSKDESVALTHFSHSNCSIISGPETNQ